MLDLLEAAIERRSKIAFRETDAYRVVDGKRDGIPGLTIDRLGSAWLASVRTNGEPPRPLLAAMPRIEGIDALWWKHLDRYEKESSPRCLWSREGDSGSRAEVPCFRVRENGMVFEIDLSAGCSHGIFLDQRLNRKRVVEASRGRSVLNLFAYACGFSVAVGLGGGTATSLDLSQPYLDWGRRNFTANGLDPDQHYWCRGDSFEWLERFARSGRRFGGVILDPPTFSRSGKGKQRRSFRVEEDFGELVSLAAEVLEPGGFLLATTNCRRFSPEAFAATLESRLGGGTRFFAMPPEYRDEQYLKTGWWEL